MFLRTLRALSEFDEKAYYNAIKKCGREEGFAKGAVQKEQKMYRKLLSKGKSVEEIADMLDENVERVNYVLQLEL